MSCYSSHEWQKMGRRSQEKKSLVVTLLARRSVNGQKIVGYFRPIPSYCGFWTLKFSGAFLNTLLIWGILQLNFRKMPITKRALAIGVVSARRLNTLC